MVLSMEVAEAAPSAARILGSTRSLPSMGRVATQCWEGEEQRAWSALRGPALFQLGGWGRLGTMPSPVCCLPKEGCGEAVFGEFRIG